jgi:CNT family concentrative nucleoside transporter
MTRILFFLSLFVLSIYGEVIANEVNLNNKWFLTSASFISNNDTSSIITSSETDSLILKENGVFNYNIKSKDLYAVGEWKAIDGLIYLSYFLPKDTIRSYTYKITDTSLVLLEKNLNQTNIFTYKINKKEYSITHSEGFTFSSFFRGIIGIITLLLIAFLFSKNRKAINWSLVGKGLLLQFILALLILKVPFVHASFKYVSSVFVVILDFTSEGSKFLFGSFMNVDSFGYIFAFQVLPTIVFFSAITSLLFYYGILQKIVYFFARIMKKTLTLSGSESLSAAGNIFLGQTESPLLIKPYIEKMTMSELLCLMAGGMATIAGGVFAAYIGFLGGDDPEQRVFFAQHLLMASVMSAPAAIVAAKILLPETEEFNEKMEISDEKLGGNALEAISIGTTQGLRLAINVGAMLLVFVALVAMINYFLEDFIGTKTGLNDWVSEITNSRYKSFSLEFILGHIFAPISWLIGVAKEDIFLVGQLLGEKTILNEFYAYESLRKMRDLGSLVNEKSLIISTYVLCGFANLSSIGIQIGGIGSLAPSRRGDLSRLGVLALIAGTLACLFTGVIVGMLI